MAKRKSKPGSKQEDGSYLIESSAHQSSGTSSYVLPGLLFLIIAIGGSTLGVFCMQQQYNLDQLSESFTAMQTRIANFQHAMGMKDAQMHSEVQVEERISALEEAQRDAQQKAEVALETSESLKNSDLHSQIWSLHAEIDGQLVQMQQVAASTAALHAMLRNKSEEFDAVKESVANILSASSVLAAGVAGLNSAVGSTNARLNEQVAVMDALSAHMEGHASELNDMKVALDLHKIALYANSQDVVMIKQLVEAEQAMRALMLEKKLSSVEKTLDEQLMTSQSLHTNIKAQLKNVHSQLLNGGQPSSQSTDDVESDVEAPPAVEDLEAVTSPTEELKEDVEEEEEKEEVQEKELEQATEVPVGSEHVEEVTDSPDEGEQEEEVEQDVENYDLPDKMAEEEVTDEIVAAQELEESLEEDDSDGFVDLGIAE